MKEKVIFIAGVYGVGKSTLCAYLSRKLGIPAYSAGDLISAENGEQYGAKKYVKDKNANQDTLISAISHELSKHGSFLLAGHFCIFDKDNKVDILPNEAFSRMNISRVLILEADTDKVIHNLNTRDGKKYKEEEISELQNAELFQARAIANALGVPLLQYKMSYDGNDGCNVAKILGG